MCQLKESFIGKMKVKVVRIKLTRSLSAERHDFDAESKSEVALSSCSSAGPARCDVGARVTTMQSMIYRLLLVH